LTLNPGQMLSHYRLMEKLGEGGMGVVFKALDTRLNRQVAIKVLPASLTSDPERRLRFQREAQTIAVLSHPNIAVLYEVGREADVDFLVMEYLKGKTLREVIGDHPIAARQWLQIGLAIAEGLAHAHRHGVIHRDLKPDNVILTDERQVKLLDFGLAKLVAPESDDDASGSDVHTRLETISRELTRAGKVFGTVAYMSPEQARGEPLDHRSDLFSFGIVLYQMAGGRLPFRGRSEIETLHSIIAEEPSPLSQLTGDLPSEGDRIVRKAMEKEPERRYQDAADLATDLKNLQRDMDSGKVSIPSGPVVLPKPGASGPSRLRLPKLGVLLGGLAGVAILGIAAFLYFRTPKAVPVPPAPQAAENTLAILYFENVADPADHGRFGQMVPSLLITDLSESRSVKVVSRQRLFDILRSLGKEDLKVIDSKVATEIARKANVKWMLTGQILQEQPRIVVTADISDSETGEVQASQRVTGDPGDDVFAVVDKLGAEVRKDLAGSGGGKDIDRPVADVTTHSTEAYRYYLEGMDQAQRNYASEARQSFNKAVELDPTLAMAHFRLSLLGPTPAEAREHLAKAVQNIDRVSDREKPYIRSAQAFQDNKPAEGVRELEKLIEQYPDEKDALLNLGNRYLGMLHNPEKAITTFNRIIEIDPLHKQAYNSLAYAYDDAGNFAKALWAINQYISLVPEEANPYDSRADLYAHNGKLDEAIDSYRKAIEKKHDFDSAWRKLGGLYLLKGQYAEAEKCFRELAASDEKLFRSQGRLSLAKIPLYQGKFTQALKVLEEGIASDRFEGFPALQKKNIEARIYRESDKPKALAQMQANLQEFQKLNPTGVLPLGGLACTFARNGEFDKAKRTAADFKAELEKKAPDQMASYEPVLGCIEREQGNYEAAVEHWEKAAQSLHTWDSHFELARTYLLAGRLGESLTEFERVASDYSELRSVNTIDAVKLYYFLGQVYEKSGSRAKAIENYRQFLDIWKNADPGIVEVEDAKQRLAHLQAGS
jgi:eukaryotic-like serine/threonine-protein kinase